MTIPRISRAALLASTTLSFALISVGASAQDATKEAPATMLDEIIVTAGKEKVAIDTPQAVTSVGQDEIEQKQAATIGEILDDIPGLSVINPDSIFGAVNQHSRHWRRFIF